MEPIQCFVIEPTNVNRISLRRYVGSDNKEKVCPLPHGYHDAQVFFKDIPDGVEMSNIVPTEERIDSTDRVWPKSCECGYEFQEEDHWQYFNESLYVRKDTNEIVTLRSVPVGAMWFAPWLDQMYVPQLEHVLVVKLPNNHDWVVDSEASNCTMPKKALEGGAFQLPYQQDHHCWVLHGVPPMVTVDKNGNTCQAGGGSIAIPGWHGYLQNGVLHE